MKITYLIASTLSTQLYAQEPILKTGYVWNDTKGKLGIKVSLSKQMIYIYRDNVLVSYSRIPSGKKGHATPTGIITIKAKYKIHTSSIHGSSMPYTQRLTYDGIALDAGNTTLDKTYY